MPLMTATPTVTAQTQTATPKVTPAAPTFGQTNTPLGNAPNSAGPGLTLPGPPQTPAPNGLQSAQLQQLQDQHNLGLLQQAASNAGYGVNVGYAQGQYNTGNQNLNIDQRNIQQQLGNLHNDQAYYKGILGTTTKDYRADLTYDQQQNQLANQLYQALSGQYGVQSGLQGQQLQDQLAKIATEQAQAQGQFANQSQLLGQQVGQQGAFGSRGAQEQQAFLQSTLGNTLGGLQSDIGQAHSQYGLSQSQLANEGSQALNSRNSQLSLDQRRQVNATQGISRANLDYLHALSGMNLNHDQLVDAAAKIGVSRQQLNDSLHYALGNAAVNRTAQTINNSQANVGYGSDLAQILGQISQNPIPQPAAYNNIGGPTGSNPNVNSRNAFSVGANGQGF